MALKKLTDKDRDAVAKLLSDYWSDRGMKQYDKKWADDYLIEGHKKETLKDEFFVYKEQELIGVISLITNISKIAEIRDMVVKSEYRNKGHGSKILQELIIVAKERRIRKLFALIFPQHKKMYLSAGFVEEGVLKSHFTAGEDLIVMSKFL